MKTDRLDVTLNKYKKTNGRSIKHEIDLTIRLKSFSFENNSQKDRSLLTL